MSFVSPSIELVESHDDECSRAEATILYKNDEITIQDDPSCNLNFSSSEEEEGQYKLVNSMEDFEECLRLHEVETYTKYTIYKTNGPFKGRGKEPLRKPRIHWGALAKACASLATTPYLIIGTRYYVCHLGKCYYTAKLQKNLIIKHEENKKRYKKVTSSKKVGCPANFKVQRLVLFPDNKLSVDTPSERARMGDFIRRNISSVRVEHKYLFKFPKQSDHENHMEQDVASGKEPIDKRVVNKIRDLVFSGQTNILSVMELVEEFVEREIKGADRCRRRFFPSKLDIQRVLHKAKLNLRKSKTDQERVEALKGSLGGADEVFFQSSLEDKAKSCQWNLDGNSFLFRKLGLLFVYQSHEMRRLYRLYGSQCILLDPTYKFCKLPFPLYFVVVQTNVNFQVVAVLIAEYESKEAIIEALSVLAHWNPTVVPKYALTDNNSDEIKALGTVFPEIKVFIASYYCRVEWEQRLLRKDMKGINRKEALDVFKTVANATTEDKTQKAINELKAFPCPPLKEYFEKCWQKDIKRWAISYRPSDSLFEANDAIERLDEELKFIIVSKMRDLDLSQIISQLCSCVIPEMLQQYKTLNENILRRPAALSSYTPSYLLERPQWIMDLLLERASLADRALQHSYAEYLSDGNYTLLSKSSNSKYNLKFDIEQKQVTCTCFQFMLRRVICKHALIIGRFYPMWNMEKINSWVLDNPIFKKDQYYCNQGSGHLENGNHSEVPVTTSVESLPDVAPTQSSSVTTQLRDSCTRSLKSLGDLVGKMNASQLETFHENLQDFCSRWIPTDRLKSGDEGGSEDIPTSFLKKISDFYADPVNGKSSRYGPMRKARKRKKYSPCSQGKMYAKAKKKRLAEEKKASDIQMCNITTFCKVEKSDVSIPLYTVKIEGDMPTDPSHELETSKEIIEEYLDGKSNVVIHITGQDDSSVTHKAIDIFPSE